MSQTIPLSRLSTSSPFSASRDSPLDAEYQNGLAYDNVDEAQSIPTAPWQKDLYMLLEQPTSSQAAFLVHICTTSLIAISAVVTVLETVPAFHSISGGVWFGLETTLVVLFTVEYIGRCVAHATTWSRFFRWVGCESLSSRLPWSVSTLGCEIVYPQSFSKHCSDMKASSLQAHLLMRDDLPTNRPQ